MIAEILRFNAAAKRWLRETQEDKTLASSCRTGATPRSSSDHYIVPMGRAIGRPRPRPCWVSQPGFSSTSSTATGFLNVDDRPVWQTVTGGTREYVRALLQKTPAEVRLSTPVESIRRQPNQVQVRTRRGDVETFDYAFSAATRPGARAARVPTPRKARRSGRSRMRRPKRSCTRTSRCCRGALSPGPRGTTTCCVTRSEPVALTYDMNVLQSLPGGSTRFLVTLNHRRAIDERRILRTFQYAHPVYTPAASRPRHGTGN